MPRQCTKLARRNKNKYSSAIAARQRCRVR